MNKKGMVINIFYRLHKKISAIWLAERSTILAAFNICTLWLNKKKKRSNSVAEK